MRAAHTLAIAVTAWVGLLAASILASILAALCGPDTTEIL